MKFPVNRRGKKESLDHYLQRLNTGRSEAYLQSVKHQWGEFLNKYPWDVVGHFTFNKAYSVPVAIKTFQNYLMQYPSCYSYFSIEETSQVHIHALLGRVVNMAVLPWGLGYYQVMAFDTRKGAAWYVSKCPSQNWHMFGGFPKEKPAGADRWWRPGITLDPRHIVGLQR